MFYVKHEANGETLNIEITDENVYTLCPNCGKEKRVDLGSIGEFDLFSTAIFCNDCAKPKVISKYMADHLGEK